MGAFRSEQDEEVGNPGVVGARVKSDGLGMAKARIGCNINAISSNYNSGRFSLGVGMCPKSAGKDEEKEQVFFPNLVWK